MGRASACTGTRCNDARRNRSRLRKSSDSDSTQGASHQWKNMPKELTIDVFDSQANFQGEQTGWFAKLIKDKFNIQIEHYCNKRGRWWRYFISDTFCKR